MARRARLLLVGAMLALAATTASAEDSGEPSREGSFAARVDVELVNIEVVVTDRAGRAVEDLGSSDFTVLEDGEEVEITHFRAPPARSAETRSPMTSRALPADPPYAPRPVIAVLVDNRSIRPEHRLLLFDGLRRWIDGNREMAGSWTVASLGHQLDVAVPVTDDLDKLLTGIEALEAQASIFAAFDGSRRLFMSQLDHASLRPYSPRGNTEGDPEFDDAVRVALYLADTVRTLAAERHREATASLNALAAFCDLVAALPGRKALLYLSDGLPLRPADSLITAWVEKFETWVLQNEDDIRLRSRFPEAMARFQQLLIGADSSHFDLQADLNRVTARAAAAGVVVYAISAAGGALETVSAEHSGAGYQVGTGSGSMRRDAAGVESLSADSSLLKLAEDTGGAAILRSGSIGSLLDRLRRDASSFYSLGFPPRRGDEGRAFRRLAVSVHRPGLVVRHPRGYERQDWRRRLGQLTVAAAVHDVGSNPLAVELEAGSAVVDGDRYRMPLLVKIPFESIRLVHRERKFEAQVTLLVVVRERDGSLSETIRIDLPVKVPDDRMLYVAEQRLSHIVELELSAGEKRIAVGVHDHLGAADATAALDVVLGAAPRHD